MSDTAPPIMGEAQRQPPELTLNHLDALPTLPPVAIKLLQVTADDSTGAQDVVAALRGDQSLTAKILSLANTVSGGSAGKVSTLDRAVVMLGFRAVRSIALAVTVFECLTPMRREETGERHFDRTEFWKHSMGVGCAARRLARAREQFGVDPEEAFVGGLLHDMGKVALDAVFPKAYERVAARAEELRCAIADCERAVLGIDHTVAGRHLAKRWKLPRAFQEVVWLHHVSTETLTDNVSSPKLIALVQLANNLVTENHIGHSGDHCACEPAANLAHYLGFPIDALDQLARDVVSDVADYSTLLGLDEVTPESMYLRSLTRANTELGRLNTDLSTSNQRLSAAARYFKAVTEFDHQLSGSSELSAVVAAIARGALTALQRTQLVALGVHDQGRAVELCHAALDDEPSECTMQRVSEELREWLSDPGEVLEMTVVRAPLVVRGLVAPLLSRLGEGEAWLLPIVHDDSIAGGIVFLSERNERSALAAEASDLRSFLTSLGLALGRANAQASARRLSEDLAESNRRLQQMQQEVLRTRALSMIAEMASGAGHELNSPLTVISGRAQMLIQSIDDPETCKTLEQMRDKAHECAQIVKDLMDFARPAPPQPQVTDLRRLLLGLRDDWLQKTGLPASQLAVDLPPENRKGGVPQLYIDHDQIRIALDEVIENALTALNGSNGSIRVSWQSDVADPVLSARAASLSDPLTQPAAARWVELTIEDSGVGMAPDVVHRAFDPFYSHRAAGRGRGLGLARAHRIAESHGGRIWLKSQLGEGTDVHILLPQVGSGF